MSSPSARCVQAVIPNRRRGTPPQRHLSGPGTSTCRVFSPGGAHHHYWYEKCNIRPGVQGHQLLPISCRTSRHVALVLLVEYQLQPLSSRLLQP